VNKKKLDAAYKQALYNYNLRTKGGDPYEAKKFPLGGKLYRASGSEKYNKPGDIGFYAVDKNTRRNYVKIGLPRRVDFETKERLRLFVMNRGNLSRLVGIHKDDNALVKAVENVTAVGLSMGGKYDRYRGGVIQRMYNFVLSVKKTRNTFNALPDFIRTLLPSDPYSLAALAVVATTASIVASRPRVGSNTTVLHVNTSGYLSKENKRNDVYASKRLAKELQRILKPLGYDGWVYEPKAAIRAAPYYKKFFPSRDIPFHQEVMLWNNKKVVAVRLRLPSMWSRFSRTSKR